MIDELVAVVLHFRTPIKTLGCLRSLADEGISRAVLVDNSEDGGASFRAMEDGLRNLRAFGLTIEVLEEGRNLGFSAGVNRALAHIRRQGRPDVLLINSDARLMPEALRAMKSAMHSGVEVVAPTLVSTMGDKKRPLYYYQKHTGFITRHMLPGSFAYVTGACLLLSGSINEQPLFDEEFFFYGEDVMLSADLHAKGKRWTVEEGAEVLHEGSGSARNGSLFYEYHINRGHLLLARKLCPDKVRYLPILTLSLLLRAIIRSIRSGSVVPIRGLRLAFLGRSSKQAIRLTPASKG